MNLHYLNYVTYFLSLIFIAFLYHSLSWRMIKTTWKNAVLKVKVQGQTKKALENGLKKFEFGNTVIYAKTTQGAIFKYRALKREMGLVRKQNKKR